VIYKSERDKARFHVRKCDEWDECTWSSNWHC
jgi:hypothetical protein